MRLLVWLPLVNCTVAIACSGTSGDPEGVPEAPGSSSGDVPSASSSSSSSSSSSGGAEHDARSEASEPEPTYAHETIDFDDQPSGTVVTDQYATWAKFSTEAGCSLEVSSAANVAASKPFYVLTYYSCAHGSTAPYYIEFVRPVRKIAFKLVGVNSAGKVATVRAIDANGTTLETKDLLGVGNPFDPLPVTMVAAGVKRIEIVDVDDAFGLGLDDVEFDFPDR